MTKALFKAMLLALLLVCSPLHAENVAWDSLPTNIQKILQQVKPQWQKLDDEQRVKYIRGAERWAQLPPEKREEAKKRFTLWKKMTAEERDIMRKNFERYKHLSPEVRERIRESYNRFKALPSAEQNELKEKWKALPPDEKAKIRVLFNQ